MVFSLLKEFYNHLYSRFYDILITPERIFVSLSHCSPIPPISLSPRQPPRGYKSNEIQYMPSMGSQTIEEYQVDKVYLS